MEGLFFFTGENDFALRAKVALWVDEFCKKHGEDNLLRLYGKEVDFREVIEDVSVAPFIAEKRLVIVHGMPKAEKEQVQLLVTQKHESVILVIIEAKPDKRLSSTKEMLKVATVEEFPLLSSVQIRQWAAQEANKTGATFPSDVLDSLIDRVGEDQSLLHCEIQKIGLYASRRTVTAEDIDTMILCSGEREVWALMDMIGRGDCASALAYVRRLLKQGENAHGIWAILLWMLSSVVPIKAAVDEGITSPAAIAKQCGVSFGSARSMLPVVRKMSSEKISEIVRMTTDFDVQLKTGGHKATIEEPQELEAIIDRTLIACCG